MWQVMLDLETMGTHNNAAIMTIAAMAFDLETGKVSPNAFNVNVDLVSSAQAGLRMDAETILWWMDQSTEARQAWRYDPKPLRDAISALSYWFMQWGGKDTPIWGNGATFDLVIIETAFRKVSINIPWSFRSHRDVRTLLSLRPEIKVADFLEGTKHIALHDVLAQIKAVTEAHKCLAIG